MRVIIAGGRDYVPHIRDGTMVQAILLVVGATEVVSGRARGADQWGESIARLAGLPCQEFPARWEMHGKAAGHLRNKQMADYADILIAMPGGRGTANMVAQMQKAGKPVYAVAQGVIVHRS